MSKSNFHTRKKQPEHSDQNQTRTLLITNIPKDVSHVTVRNLLNTFGEIKEIYTIKHIKNILFVLYYDIRHAIAAKEYLSNNLISSDVSTYNLTPYYTVSKYEIPVDLDICDEQKNQGTVILISRGLTAPITESEIKELFMGYGEIKAIREYKPFQKFIIFYDSRSAVKAVCELSNTEYKEGNINLRFMWDHGVKTRWESIKETDLILKSLPIEESAEDEENLKKIRVEKNLSFNGKDEEKFDKRGKYLKGGKNVYLQAFDDFVMENINKIYKMVKRDE